MPIKPILFNTEMVRAILDGRKTCTRRVIKLPENMDGVPIGKSGDSNNPLGFMYPGCIKRPPYQPGDILYVRETWCALPVNEAGHMRGHSIYYYRADGDLRPEGWRGKWRQSIHMPKEAARIWLKVTDVKVERLQNITEDGSKAEGAIDNRGFIHSPDNEYDRIHTAREHLNSTIKKSSLDRYGWDASPWVWVIEFERCEKPEEI
ncbi:MAG: hypothetical protein ACLVBT_09820 [Roseburia hominis]